MAFSPCAGECGGCRGFSGTGGRENDGSYASKGRGIGMETRAWLLSLYPELGGVVFDLQLFAAEDEEKKNVKVEF